MERASLCSLLTSAAIGLAVASPLWAHADEGRPPGMASLEFASTGTPSVAKDMKILNEEGDPPKIKVGLRPDDALILLQAQSRQQDEGLPPGQRGPA